MPGIEWEEIRREFAWSGPGAYLNTAAEGLWLRRLDGALSAYAAAKGRGALGRPELAAVEERTRAAVARLLGGRPEDIAFVSSTSRALDVAVGLIDLPAGSNIVLLDSEFPSAIVTGHRLRDAGVEVRQVPALPVGADESALVAHVDDRTAVIIVSSVSFITGRRVDVAELRRLLGDRQPVVIVDAIQSAGVAELPLGDIDILIFGTYKWLLGPHGLAVVHLDPVRMADAQPAYRGWRGVADAFAPDRLTASPMHRDARRLEDGMPNYLGLTVLERSLEFLGEIGLPARSARVAELVDAFTDALDRRGIGYGPAEPDRRVGIVTIPTRRAEDVAARLAGEGFQVWGREGVLRVSPYLHTTHDELAALAAALPGGTA